MRIGLIDVDGHRFPSLALMRISAWHKAQGNTVEWWLGDMFHYDRVYKSKVFSDVYSNDIPDPINADEVFKGGTGYAISLKGGKEVYDKSKDAPLPAEIERMFPDYSLYPQYDYAVAMTSRGCPRGCSFCHVAAKEGRASKKVADVKDFWQGQGNIEVLDPNITACKDKHDLFMQYAETGAVVNFDQGLDIRLITEQDIADLNAIKIKSIHFAWDNPNDDLRGNFETFARSYKGNLRSNSEVFVLTNFNSTMEENLYRIYTLRDLGYNPYVMVYNKPNAPKEIKRLQRWCNNKFIFRSCERFEDYDPKKG